MKKILIGICSILLLLILVSCSGEENASSASSSSTFATSSHVTSQSSSQQNTSIGEPDTTSRKTSSAPAVTSQQPADRSSRTSTSSQQSAATSSKTSSKPSTSSQKPQASSSRIATSSRQQVISKPQSSSKAPASSKVSSNPPTSGSSRAEQILTLVNQERAKAGVSPLQLDSTLSANATVRAKEIVSKFDHTRPDGSKFQTAVTIPWRTVGENIAWGQKTPQAVMSDWMGSSGHRANILKASYSKLGVGVYESSGRLYWVQLFVG